MRIKSFVLKGDFWICLGLVLITLVVFLQTANFGFAGVDDYNYLVKNENVSTGLSIKNVKWAFSSVGYVGNWYPLTWISYMVDIELFGLNSGAHHVVNFIIHVCSVLLLYLLLRWITGGRWQSAFVAAIFAIHPLRAESVAFIAERKDVLSTFFFLAAIAAYVKYVKNSKFKNYLLIIVFFVLGALSKAMVITLPFVLLLLDHWPLKRVQKVKSLWTRYKKLIWEKVPLFFVSVVLAFITAAAAEKATTSFESLPLLLRLKTAIFAYGKYIIMMIWPRNLGFLASPVLSNIAATYVFRFGLLLAAITIFAFIYAKKHPYLLVGWLWFLGTLVPVIGLVRVGSEMIADRFTYIPQIGFLIMVVWGIGYLIKFAKIPKIAVIATAIIVLALFTIAGFLQVGYWKDPITLFEHTVKINPNAGVAHIALCTAFAEQKQYEKALPYCDRAVELVPDHPLARENRNTLRIFLGKPIEP